MRIYICLLVLLIAAAPAWAVKTSHWIHTTEADFKDGTFHGVVASNLGDLKLSRQVKTLLGQDARVSAVFALAEAPDGTVYAGTGPEGLLLAVKNDKVTTAAELGPHTNIFSLLVDSKGRLLIGTAGEKGQILRIDKPGEKPKPIFADENVQYIWSMIETPDGHIYAATGPSGQLIDLSPDGSHKVLLDSDENNLLCMLSDGKDYLYIGTDPDGLVYRVNRKTGEMFVLYDAAESEVSALAMDAKGNLYAATAQSAEDENAEEPGEAEQVGRPEAPIGGTAIPSVPPSPPKPPDVPKPAPGEPIPIPKVTRPMSMLILAAGDEPTPGGGNDDPGADAPTTSEKSASHIHAPGATASATPATPSPGNAIYRIDPQGFVNEIFRQPASVYAMIFQGDSLLVATGDEGEIFQVDPAAEETLVLAKADSKTVLCLLPLKDGRIFMGMANAGDIAAMSSGYASEGTYLSPVLDARQISQFGKIELHGTLPSGTSLKIATRSGNVEETTAPGWSNWSQEIPAVEFVQIPSPSARFFQYRLTFTSDAGKSTPIVEDVNVAYQVPNMAPQIKAIKLPDADADADDEESHHGTGKLTLTWMAKDPNEDELVYSLYFRSGMTAPWILLKDKLKDPTFDWDTRLIGDGRYELKVEASDAAANAPGEGKTASRVSDPILVDNTAPVVGDIASTVSGTSATLKLRAVDRTSTVARLDYSVDSSDNWQTVLPSDKIADSPQEAYEVVISGLSAGAHQITLRAADAMGNRGFESVNVVIGAADKPAAAAGK